MITLIIPSPELKLLSTRKQQCQFPTESFHSPAPSNQLFKNKRPSALPLIFQAPMRSPKEFPPALWTFNSFSNDLLAAWPPNDMWATLSFLFEALSLWWQQCPWWGLPFPHSRRLLQHWEDLNENSSKGEANILCCLHQCYKDWIIFTKFLLDGLCSFQILWSWWGQTYLGGPFHCLLLNSEINFPSVR